jgi:hypothetical protein
MTQKLRLLKKLLLEMGKVDRHQNGGMPSPMFINDRDITGHYPNKSALRKIKKDK